MNELNLNLAGLSEEELNHISNVLSRDKKLQEKSNIIKLNIDNNNVVNRKPIASANDIVSAEIDRVKRLTPVSQTSGKSSPTSPTSDMESGANREEGFFKSFAGMISRTVCSMDFSNKEERKSIGALAGAVITMNSLPKKPFSYNPRESFKVKPTLLELAAARPKTSTASTVNGLPVRTDSAISQYRRSRANAAFFSAPTPSTSYTIPRNFRSDGLKVVNGPKSPRPRSPSLPKDTLATPKFTVKCPALSPKSPKRFKKLLQSPPYEKDISSGGGANNKLSPEKILQGGLPVPSKMVACQERDVPEILNCTVMPSTSDDKKLKQEQKFNFSSVSSQSNDSGICSKTDYTVRKYDNESSMDDDIESEQSVTPDYEPDTEFVYETERRRCHDILDDVSLNSATSSYLDSPTRRILSEYVPDSWDESDHSSGIFVGSTGFLYEQKKKRKGVTSPPVDSRPRWVKSKDQKYKKHSRNVSAGSESVFITSAGNSPSLSNKSLTLPAGYSPISKREPVQSPPYGESADSIGNLEISAVFYSIDCLRSRRMKKVDIPTNGTKCNSMKNCNVLSRKEYVEVTHADLSLSDRTESGCPEDSYGELHVTIKGAKFQDLLGKIKSPNTYVKCYLLPDKFHASKMKSAVIKKSKEPRWEHTFVLAGFSQSELRERSLEIIVGSWHFKKQEVLGGAILSVGQGGPRLPWINSTKAESYLWKTALQISGNKVTALLPLRANMKPTYM